jgi:Subtilase family/Carboxypeptidase regulatory-like domain
MWNAAKRGIWALALSGILLPAAELPAQERRLVGESDSPWAIHLKSGTFVPAQGVEPALRDRLGKSSQGSLGLIQLEEIPDDSVRAQLQRAGVELLEYIPQRTWIARLPADVDRVASVITVRWIGRLLPEDKLAPELGPILLKKGTNPLVLSVEAVEGSLEEAAARVQALGGQVTERDSVLSLLQVSFPRTAVRSLADSDAVLWISPDHPKTLLNDRSRANARADQVQAAPYSLNGAGVQLGIWDGGEIFTHTDFSGRLTRVEVGGVTSDIRHATHVAGTMAGNGALSQAVGFSPNQFRGFATGAQIIGYRFDGIPYSEHNAAINTWGIDASQNSWGFIVNASNCSLFGSYPLESREYDRIVTGAYSRRIPVVFAAGNERDDGDCGMSSTPPYLNYANITPPATAKDVISVGAINGDNSAMTTFSSWGPTTDSRLKPDLVAAGCNALPLPAAPTAPPAIISTIPNNGYGTDCGTSMAAPAVSGSIGLLLQRYRAVCPATGADPLPSTVKALLIHTARDLDDSSSYLNPGPDYASGYGALDVQAAVDMLPFHREDQVSQGQTDTFQITVTRQKQLKVTLVWDDAPAAAGASVALVNNLNLELVAPNGTVFRPWILNPVSPGSNATRGVDNRNVVEQVVVDDVTALAGTWTIRVIGTSVPTGSQRYSLVTQHLRPADLSCQGAPSGDVWIMDKDAPLLPVDTGAEPNPDNGPMWISNQIWVRRAADGVMAHQNPVFPGSNYIYARIRNRGGSRINTVRVMVYYADASVGLSWPRDWNLIGERTVVNLASGSSQIIAPLDWRPPGTGHFCLYVRLLTDQDSITFPEIDSVYANAQNNNEIAWRNVNVVDLRGAPRAATGQAKSSQEADLLLANTRDVSADLSVNFDMVPDASGHTLLDFATVIVTIDFEAFKNNLEEQGLDFSSFGSAGGFERIDDATFQMVAPTAYFTTIPVSGRRQLGLHISIEGNDEEAPSPVYTLDVNQNFPPASGLTNSGSTKGSTPPFDPEDPNVGGVRYDVFVPSGTGTLSGTVTDGENTPLPGVTVNLSRDSSLTQVTDALGQFRFLTVDAGPWSLGADLEGFTAATSIVTVPNGGNNKVTLVLTAEPEKK